MKTRTTKQSVAFLAALTVGAAATLALARAPSTPPVPSVGVSPWGPNDEIGRLNLMTADSRAAILGRLDPSRVYDLSVEYFIGMPSWQAAGDPPYQMWLTHTPRGNVIADPMSVGVDANEHVSYTGAAVSMYVHTGTHIDALSHFGLVPQVSGRRRGASAPDRAPLAVTSAACTSEPLGPSGTDRSRFGSDGSSAASRRSPWGS